MYRDHTPETYPVLTTRSVVLPINFKSGNGGSDRKLTCRARTPECAHTSSPAQPGKTGKLTTMSVIYGKLTT